MTDESVEILNQHQFPALLIDLGIKDVPFVGRDSQARLGACIGRRYYGCGPGAKIEKFDRLETFI